MPKVCPPLLFVICLAACGANPKPAGFDRAGAPGTVDAHTAVHVLNRLAFVNLPQGLQPQLSPWQGSFGSGTAGGSGIWNITRVQSMLVAIVVHSVHRWVPRRATAVNPRSGDPNPRWKSPCRASPRPCLKLRTPL